MKTFTFFFFLLLFLRLWSQEKEQLIIFLGEDSASQHFKNTRLSDLQHYADSNNIETSILSTENGIPLEVEITPSFYYQNYRGRSVYSGRYLTLDRLINFMRTAKYSPRQTSYQTKTNIPIHAIGKATIATPIKITALQGTIPSNFDQNEFTEEVNTHIAAGFQHFRLNKQAKLASTDRLFYTDYYPYLSKEGMLYISTAVYSMFHCHEAVYESKAPIVGKWEDRATLFKQAAAQQEKVVLDQLHNLHYGDAFQAIGKDIPTKTWKELGLALPSKKKHERLNFELKSLPHHWIFDQGLADGSPLVQFHFGTPVDHYAGEAKQMKMQLHLENKNTLLGAKGHVVVNSNSITMGDEGLDEYILNESLKAGMYPNASYTFTIVQAPKTWGFLEPQHIQLQGEFLLLGKAIKLSAAGTVEVILDQYSLPKLRLNGNFTLPIKQAFGIEGPDGPSPASEELYFQLNFLLKPTQQINTLQQDLYTPKKQSDAYTQKKEEDYLRWYASTKLYKAKGNFEHWHFDTLAIPNNNLEKVKAKVVIDIHSLSERSKLLVKHLKGEHFFEVGKFPMAYVTIDGAKALNDSVYSANATATIKGVSAPIDLNFQKDATQPTQIIGIAKIDREVFGVGTSYKKAKSISKIVELKFGISLSSE